MLVKELTSVRQKVACTISYLISSHRVTPSQVEDHCSICNGLTLWAGILLDTNVMLGGSLQEQNGRKGRILSMPLFSGSKEVDLTVYLSFLDELDDWILFQMSSSERFKGALPKGIKAPASAGIVLSLIRLICKRVSDGEMLDTEALRLAHQVCCFLSKIQLDRPDLVELANAEFISFEHDLSKRPRLRDNPEVSSILDEMNALARTHLLDWTPDPFRPRHGPGATADVEVKCWYDKYLHMNSDARVAYLLNRYNLGTEVDYCPWVKPEKSTRTSRFIPVPKTWKKLRGISAEPVELQFYQQAVLRSLDRLFTTSKWWKDRVDLHDQGKSGRLALFGSLTNSIATIDLSAASDSVTLELVKEVFKGTPLLYWLLGTRCTFSICDEQVVRLAKFAPMGSACCFPVECIIFTLAAQVASDRTRLDGLDNDPTIRVFGDDIVIDWYSADTLVEVLNQIGFKVNTRKSYLIGNFREACGVEAYRGTEVQPLRYKRLGGDFRAWTPLVGDIATALSYSNSLYSRGFHGTRSYLVQILLNSEIAIGKKRFRVGNYIPATFSGTRGSLASPLPTNFNRLLKSGWPAPQDASVPWYQARLVKSLGFRVRLKSYIEGSEMSELYSMMLYHEWQLEHQSGLVDYDKKWEKGWCDLGLVSGPDSRLPLGSVTVPTVKWVLWDYIDSLV